MVIQTQIQTTMLWSDLFPLWSKRHTFPFSSSSSASPQYFSSMTLPFRITHMGELAQGSPPSCNGTVPILHATPAPQPDPPFSPPSVFPKFPKLFSICCSISSMNGGLKT
ncbi:hypothetical protein CRENBAI_016172 [Crenichthys baileyi]|uniref:Uncharacterized protein n=1 Tax=Crenichthys baileyi TaxID=28760 RepID=A0AAV9QQJ1_9TELE